MLLPRKWALGLGLLAATPGLTLAGPFDSPKASGGRPEAAAQSSERSNEEVARQIATVLKQAKLVHKDVKIEYKAGVATIQGQIKDAGQRNQVTNLVSRVPGVQTVENQLTVMEAATLPAGGVQQAAHQGDMHRRVTPVNHEQQTARSNQEVAQQIAESLTSAGLSGYEIEVRYKNGIASLVGNVEHPDQVRRAHQACATVPGVSEVVNRLTVKGQAAPAGQAGYPQRPPGYPQGAPAGYPIQQTQAMAPQGMMPPGMPPQGMTPPGMPPQGMTPPGMPPQGMMGPGMPPQGMMPPGGAPQYQHVQPAGHHMYNQPNVPDYAWPTYAPYDNSAAITYPGMYDASAWPYIGPYYPYPQVPMGWRKSTLEWDDGYWSLKFDSKTDRWWWFLNPHNWH